MIGQMLIFDNHRDGVFCVLPIVMGGFGYFASCNLKIQVWGLGLLNLNLGPSGKNQVKIKDSGAVLFR